MNKCNIFFEFFVIFNQMNLIYNLAVLIDNLIIRLLMVHKNNMVRFRTFPDKNDTFYFKFGHALFTDSRNFAVMTLAVDF